MTTPYDPTPRDDLRLLEVRGRPVWLRPSPTPDGPTVVFFHGWGQVVAQKSRIIPEPWSAPFVDFVGASDWPGCLYFPQADGLRRNWSRGDGDYVRAVVARAAAATPPDAALLLVAFSRGGVAAQEVLDDPNAAAAVSSVVLASVVWPGPDRLAGWPNVRRPGFLPRLWTASGADPQDGDPRLEARGRIDAPGAPSGIVERRIARRMVKIREAYPDADPRDVQHGQGHSFPPAILAALVSGGAFDSRDP